MEVTRFKVYFNALRLLVVVADAEDSVYTRSKYYPFTARHSLFGAVCSRRTVGCAATPASSLYIGWASHKQMRQVLFYRSED